MFLLLQRLQDSDNAIHAGITFRAEHTVNAPAVFLRLFCKAGERVYLLDLYIGKRINEPHIGVWK
jgi:hypothetical protein